MKSCIVVIGGGLKSKQLSFNTCEVVMKIIDFFCTLFILSSFTLVFAQGIDVKPKGPDLISNLKGELKKFRDAAFGNSVKEVKALEKSKFVDSFKEGNEETLIYNGVVGGLKCDIYYAFINDKFLMGVYFFDETHTNENLYIDDYKKILSYLKDKYGKPTDEDYYWSNYLYRDDFSKWGFAVSIGHLTYRANWTFNNGSIFTLLKGDNFKVSHVVSYQMDEYHVEKDKQMKSSNEF